MTGEPERHEHHGVEALFASSSPSESQVPAGELPEQRVVTHDPERGDEKVAEAEELYQLRSRANAHGGRWANAHGQMPAGIPPSSAARASGAGPLDR